MNDKGREGRRGEESERGVKRETETRKRFPANGKNLSYACI